MGIRVSGLTFLPRGNDNGSWAYRVDAIDGVIYFLKVRKHHGSRGKPAGTTTLQELGVPHIVGPLCSSTDSPSTNTGGLSLIVYPFVMGAMGAKIGLSARNWRTLGATLKQIHSARLESDLAKDLPVETFTPGRLEDPAIRGRRGYPF